MDKEKEVQEGHECIKCHKIKKGNTEEGMICAECYLFGDEEYGV